MEIQHFSHKHPLTIYEVDPKAAVKCAGCDLPISNPFFACPKCTFFLHKSCTELPRDLDELHIFHPIPTHHLTLLPHPPRNFPTFNCYSCHKSRCGFTYHCPKCQLNLCVNCISLVSADDYEYYEIQLPDHEHPYILCPKQKEFDISCVRCAQPIEEDSLYLCPLCILFFHESCADPPREINHPFHSQHPLTLLYLERDCEFDSFRCGACGRHGSSLAYRCADCSFNMHPGCSRLRPAVMSDDVHQHPLACFDFYTDISFLCHSCGGRFDGPFFRCVECDFSLHLHCFPSLPRSVKHESHRHALTITDSPIKDHSDEDDNAEFYCDACEERRNLHDRSYYCAEPECHFVAHIKCLISEVISSLMDEPPLVTSGSVGIEALENPTPDKLGEEIAKLDEETANLRMEIEALEAKMRALERRRAHLAHLALVHFEAAEKC